MAGDYTKFTFKPAKDYSGVWKQQGRVDLDADWNEYIEIADRRWRTETVDIIGRCTYPRLITPNAFFITPTGPGTFNIGIGRLYVHGLLVENHGLPPLIYDAVLGEQVGTIPIPYTDQPYLPAPLPPPLPGTAGTTDLIFIDVWQRELTYLEDPSIQEIALGGPDTATRLQTVWQVRALQNVGRHECPDRIEAWDALIAPSGARLTTSAVAPPASDDPCILSPAGGFRGLENRLYRVEVHTAGGIGGATPAKFKWSRDNGSVATTIDAIDGTSTQLTVRRIGRDQVLRFQVGDWVEVLDDHTEFRQISGHTARVTAIDEANRILTISPAIPGVFAFDATNPARHTRVRRWDQQIGVDANGLLDVVAGPIQLEDGVQITFTGSNFKVGDFWVFAARTADGSVEILTEAPPRGILHHSCRLGFLTWGAGASPGTFLDCRIPWPPPFGGGGNELPCECCTVTVGDGIDSHGDFTDIQLAINSLGPTGGLVCILRGVFIVRQSIILRSLRNIIIRGMGPATRIIFESDTDLPQNAFEILNCQQIRLESLYVVARRAAAIVRFNTSRLCRIEDSTLVNLSVREIGTDQPSGRAVELAEGSSFIDVRRNFLLAAKSVFASGASTANLAVIDNQSLAVQVGVQIADGDDLEITHNRLRGVTLAKLGALLGLGALTRANIDALQIAVDALFLDTASRDFQAAGVVIVIGRRVVIRQNLIVGQVAVVIFLAIELTLNDNDIFGLFGLLFFHGLMVRVNDNAVFGLVGGVIQAGLLAHFLCEANLFLGFAGISFLSPQALNAAFTPTVIVALGGAGFSASASAFVTAFTGAGLAAAGKTDFFGFIVFVKIHRNLFLTINEGIFKSDDVGSGDVSIIDNTFALCREVAIALNGHGTVGLPPSFLRFVSPRHLVQSNAFTIQAAGIGVSVPLTSILDNQIECPVAAIGLNAPSCEVRSNTIIGTGNDPLPASGLIVLSSRGSNQVIASNRLERSPGNGILYVQSTSQLRIEDNLIQQMSMNAISAGAPGVSVDGLLIARNIIRNCRMGSTGTPPWTSAAIAVSGRTGIRIVGNILNGNNFDKANLIFIEDSDSVEILDNQLHDNGVGIGVNLLGTTRSATISDNSIRQPFGAAILAITSSGEALINNNRIEGRGDSQLELVRVSNQTVIQFNGNRIRDDGAHVLFGGQMILLLTARIVANSNMLETNIRNTALTIRAVEALVNGNHIAAREPALMVNAPRGIISSNIVNFGISAPGTILRVNNT